MTNEKMFRVWSKEHEDYWEDQIDFFLCPDGMLVWVDDYGDMHRADPEQYEIVIERSVMNNTEWANLVADAAIQSHGDRHYIAIAAWMEAFCAGIDWYMRAKK